VSNPLRKACKNLRKNDVIPAIARILLSKTQVRSLYNLIGENRGLAFRMQRVKDQRSSSEKQRCPR
jgi:hypothetical protein